MISEYGSLISFWKETGLFKNVTKRGGSLLAACIIFVLVVCLKIFLGSQNTKSQVHNFPAVKLPRCIMITSYVVHGDNRIYVSWQRTVPRPMISKKYE